MERKIEIMSLTYVLFLGLLSAAGLLGGAISNILYFLSFLLPLLLAFILTGKEKLPALEFIKMDRHAAVSTLIFTFPTVALVLGISLLTSFVIGKLTGATNQVDLGDSLATALVLHAFLPALFEEVLFRFLPMRMLSVTSKRACILVSAFFFALVHHNLFSIDCYEEII